MCGYGARLFQAGTTDPKTFFEHGVAYSVAAGGDKEKLPIWKCSSCGHGWTPIDFDPQIITRWYAGYEADHIFLAQEVGRRKTGRQVLNQIKRLLPRKGNLLDIGAGPGLFLSEAATLGWQVTGIEPSVWAVEHAQKQLNITDMRRGDADLLPAVPDQSFNCVTAFDVLEHLVFPEDFLWQVSRILKPGGVLVMTTPRFDSLLALLMGKKWYCIFPAHIQYFTRRSLYGTLKRCGFDVTQEKTHTRYLGLGYVWQRLLDYIGMQTISGPASQSLIVPVNYGDEFEIYASKQ